jgi:hypothetical protein
VSGVPSKPLIPTVPCVACQEPIRRGASICTHCDSVQNVTRYLFRWSTLVTAAVALLPLWQGAQALRQIANPDHHAQVEFIAMACTRDHVVLAVTNSGDRPGIISAVTLHVFVDGKEPNAPFTLTPPASQRVVEPGRTLTLELSPTVEGVPTQFPEAPDTQAICEYRISIEVYAFAKGDSSMTLSCPCASIPGVDSPR